MESVAYGLLVGALMGTSIGPVAMWGACAKEAGGYRRALPIIFGGSVGDVFLLAVAAVLVQGFGFTLAQVLVWLTDELGFSVWGLRAIVSAVSGVLLLSLSVSDEQPLAMPQNKWHGVGAFLWTALRFDTAVAAFVLVSWFGRFAPDPFLMVVGCSIGAFIMWNVSVAVIRWISKKMTLLIPRLLKVTGILCLLGSAASAFIAYMAPPGSFALF